MPPNKGMKLTKLSAAPLRGRSAASCPRRSTSDAGSASQLIPGVGRTRRGERRRTAVLLVLLALAASGRAAELHRFGRDAARVTAEELDAIALVASSAGEPWAVLTWHSQVMPEERYADVFLQPTVASAVVRRGRFLHLMCRPVVADGVCSTWTKRPESGAYVQVLTSSASSVGMAIQNELERPIRVTGSFSDSDLETLVKYIRSEPRLPPEHGPSEVRGGSIPIEDIKQQADGSVQVTLSADGISGETAIVTRTPKGWRISQIGWWVA